MKNELRVSADRIAVVVGLLISTSVVEAQVLNAPLRPAPTRPPGVYEEVLIASRSRHFGDQLSPGGERFIYLGAEHFRAAESTGDSGLLAPTITETDGLRKISIAVVSRVPQRLRLDPRNGGELEIGVLHLPDEPARHRPIGVDSVIQLAPLHVRGRGRADRPRLVDHRSSTPGNDERNR